MPAKPRLFFVMLVIGAICLAGGAALWLIRGREPTAETAPPRPPVAFLPDAPESENETVLYDFSTSRVGTAMTSIVPSDFLELGSGWLDAEDWGTWTVGSEREGSHAAGGSGRSFCTRHRDRG